ncbi:phosphomannose isomerase type II C-terminal cupin domain [Candidatus Parcubacteria bacterium]|nr:phosphomannose isomerase type II C-terminal cupin domain [Candidatus Parcubacteria bacterium]
MENKKDQRPWGSFEVIKEEKYYKIKKLIVLPDKRLSLQKHKQRKEHWVVVKGTAKVVLEDKEFILKEGEHAFIDIEQKHRLENPEKSVLEVIEIQIGDYLEEDDIERLEDDFNRN